MSKDNSKAKTPSKPSRKYAPTRLEVIKTVLIAVMFTAIIAFALGVAFQKNQNTEVQNAVSAATAEAPVKK